MSTSAAALSFLFQPRHIAVVGASRSHGKHGNTVVKNLIRCGYQGTITPVNSAGEEVEGLRCASSLRELSSAPDCVFLAIPATAVVSAVQECANIGARSIIIGASGFAENGTIEGKERQSAITRIAHQHGMRILGPNTNGLINNDDNIAIGYNTSHAERHRPTGLSIASHSGAILNSVAKRLARSGSGFSKWVSVGNEADIDMLDIFEFFIVDPATRVIGLIIEALSDGKRFGELAVRAQNAGKPVVALKLGRSAAGAGAALAHSSRLAGRARAYEALFEVSGVANARTLEVFTGGCALLGKSHDIDSAVDNGIICVATSGGGGGMAADMASELDLPLAGSANGDFDELIDARLKQLGVGHLRNPIDLSLLGSSWAPLADVLKVMNDCGLRGPTICFAHIAARPQQDERLVNGLIARNAMVNAPVIVISPGGLLENIERLYADAGIPVFHDMVTAIESLRCWYSSAQAPRLAQLGINAENHQDAAAVAEATRLFCRARASAASNTLSESDSSTILSAAGVRMTPHKIIRTREDAIVAARQIGYPAVLKAQLPGVAHKSKHGLVIAKIEDDHTLEQAYARLRARALDLKVAENDFTALLQPMVPGKYELIAGVSYEASLGHFLIVGLGGIYSEILDEVLLFPLETADRLIKVALLKSKLFEILRYDSTKEEASLVVEQIVQTLGMLQAFVQKNHDDVDSIDINPILIHNGECTAVDSLIVLR